MVVGALAAHAQCCSSACCARAPLATRPRSASEMLTLATHSQVMPKVFYATPDGVAPQLHLRADAELASASVRVQRLRLRVWLQRSASCGHGDFNWRRLPCGRVPVAVLCGGGHQLPTRRACARPSVCAWRPPEGQERPLGAPGACNPPEGLRQPPDARNRAGPRSRRGFQGSSYVPLRRPAAVLTRPFSDEPRPTSAWPNSPCARGELLSSAGVRSPARRT